MLADDLSFQGQNDRLPPQNIEAEEAILGGVLLDPEAIARVADSLNPDAFYISQHKEIYLAALALYREGRPTDLLAVTSYLSDRSRLAGIGGRNKLATLVDRTVSAVNIDALVGLVTQKYLQRQLIKIGNEIVHLGYDSEKTINENIDLAQQKIYNLAQNSISDRPELVHASEAFMSMFEKLEARLAGKILNVKTGFYDLDKLCQCFESNELIYIAGRPAMGKTSFALCAAWNIATSQDKAVYFWSLEMSKEQMARRLVTMLTGISGEKMKNPNLLKEEEIAEVLACYSTIENSNLCIDDTSIININEIRESARRAIAKNGNKNPAAIFIDHIHILAGTQEGAENELRKISDASRQLKILASPSMGFDCPVFALAQLNRGVESRQDKHPLLSDLRLGGEQDADKVLMLYRDDYYNSESIDKGIAEIAVTKHRDGPTGTIKLLFDDRKAEFKNLARNSFG